MPYEAMIDQRPVQQVCWLPVDRIVPRASVCLETDARMSLMALTESIRQHGLVEPITVRRMPGDRYAIVSGNRRFMACRMAGLTHVDAVVLEGMEEEPNAHDLLDCVLSGQAHYLHQADALRQLVEQHGFTREELARTLGTTAAAIAQRIRLTELDPPLQAFLMEHGFPETHARALAKLPDRQARMNIARQALNQHLCIRDLELMVQSALSRLPVPPLPTGRTIALMRDHRLYLNAIRSIVAQMQESGIPATTCERAMADHIEVTLSLPTRRRRARRTGGWMA